MLDCTNINTMDIWNLILINGISLPEEENIACRATACLAWSILHLLFFSVSQVCHCNLLFLYLKDLFKTKIHTYMFPTSSLFMYIFNAFHKLLDIMSMFGIGLWTNSFYQPIEWNLGKSGLSGTRAISCIFSIKCCFTTNQFTFRNDNCICSDLARFGQVTGFVSVSLFTVPVTVSGLRSLLEHSRASGTFQPCACRLTAMVITVYMSTAIFSAYAVATS